MFIAMIALIIFMLGLAFNTNAFKKKLNYANLFLFIWCFVPALSAFGFYGFYIPPMLTYVYIFSMVIAFEVSTLFFKKVRIKKKTVKRKSMEDVHRWDLFLVVSLVCTIILIPTFIISIRYALSNGFYYLRIRILNNELFPTRNRMILQDIIQPLILVTSLISIYELVQNRKFRAVALTSIINAALYILTLGNRWLLLEIICMGVVVVIWKYSLHIITIIKKNKRLIEAAVLLLVIIAFITSQRSIRGSTGLVYDAYSYFVGSVHFLGVAVKDPATFVLDGSSYLYGIELLSGPIGFINDSLLAIKAPFRIQSGIGIINQVTQNYYFVSPTTHMNNNITMVYGFLRDGGILGVIIDTWVLGFFYIYIYKNKDRSIYDRYIYLFGVSLIPFTVFEWIYGRTYIFVTLALLIVLRWASRHFTIGKRKGEANIVEMVL